MFETIQIVAFILAGIAAYRSVFFGIIVLLISLCTFAFVLNYTFIDLPVGSLSMADFVIVAIFLKTLRTKKLIKGDTMYVLCLGMILWLTLAAFLALIEGQMGLRETYRLIFRIALFWILPVTVRGLSPSQKHRLVAICIVLAGVISGVSLVAIFSENTELMADICPTNYELYGYRSSEAEYEHIFYRENLPRLYMAGNVLVQMVFAFVLGIVLLRCRAHGRILPIVTLVLSFLFTISLGGRSNALGIMVAVVCSLFILFRISFAYGRLSHGGRPGMLFRAICILVVVFGVLINLGDTALFSRTIQGLYSIADISAREQRVRINDTIEAWNTLVQHPIWGIGTTKVHWTGVFRTYGGQDVHPVLSQGLIGGFPAILLLLGWVMLLFRRFSMTVRKAFHVRILPCYGLASAVALSLALFLSAINTTAVFLYGSTQVPFGIFCGLLFCRLNHMPVRNITFQQQDTGKQTLFRSSARRNA